MKKLFTIIAILTVCSATAQNFQLHYDFERGHYMSTLELFKPDKYGFTFGFVDFDYDAHSGISRGHEKIVRVLKTQRIPVGLEVFYEGGLGTYEYPGGLGGFTMNSCWVFGLNFSHFSRNWGFSFSPGYKKFQNVDESNFHLNTNWYIHFFKGKLTFNGVVEFWSEEGLTDNLVLNSEPQIWINVSPNLALGSEVKITNNRGNDKFEIRPSVALKWNFDFMGRKE